MSYDNTCKYLAELYPVDFVRWLLALEPREIEVLKTELNLEPIHADAVIFWLIGNIILHIEFQTITLSTPSIPLRMLDYSVRLKRRYGLAVVQVVIFLQPTTNPVAFTEEYRDETTVHRYRVIRLWEQESAPFLANPALLPLAVLTKTDSPRTLLAQVAERVASIPNIEERQNLAGCTEILAGLRFDKDLIRQFLREDMMRESVIYQDILQQGVQRGKQEGIQEGLEEGLQQGLQQGLQRGVQQGIQEEAISLVLRLASRRFGEVDSSLRERVRLLSVEQLEALAEALFDMSQLADLVAWLSSNSERN